MITPVILAAGRSARMKRPKPLLLDRDGRPFVARIVRTLAAAGLDDIVIVTGATHDLVEQALTADASSVRWECRRNPDPDRGQLSSLWVGLGVAEERGVEAVLVHLVDIPMVLPGTVRQVVDAWRVSDAMIARPAVGDKHGHPVVFGGGVFQRLHEAGLERGAKAVLEAVGARNVEVVDRGCLADIDFPADYEALARGL